MVCRQREDAEEVTQEALLRVFQNLGQLKEPERVRAWVFRIARNACLMKRRHGVFAPDRELSLDELKPELMGDHQPWPDDMVLRHELAETLDLAIAALPEIYRTVLLLRDREELSTAETAGILDISMDTVKTRLHRARLAVRHALDQQLKGGARDAAIR
jgi:RNA polymerase sigma-70 factor (ECF subfamily)